MRLAQKRRKQRMRALLVAIGLLVLVYAGLGFALAHNKVSISTINISGNESIKSEHLRSIIKQDLAVTRALVLYGGTIFTYNKANIESKILYKYPRLKSVRLSASSISALDLMVVEREAAAQWCERLNISQSLGACYVVDNDGFVYAKVDDVTPKSSLVIYTGDLTGDVLRQNLLHGEFAKVHSFIKRLKEDVGVDVIEVRLLDGEAEIKSTEHPMFKIKLDKKMDRTLSYIEVTLASDKYEIADNYIDFRFDNRVYYK